MILFFHFVCLLAQYILSNISKSISKHKVHSDDENENENDDESVLSDVLCNSTLFQKNKEAYQRHSYYEGENLKFFPPVYVQRYETVALILLESARKGKIQKVAEFGCADLNFFMYLKNMEGVTEVLEIDIDKEVLERNTYKVAPLPSDFLMGKNSKPLNVYILNGSIAEYDDILLGTDTVIAIELIEHLTEEDFKKMPYNIFSQVKPRLAVFTTPNADFNSLFPNFSGLRHADHKFEWTRREFYHWTQEIIAQYPEYSVKFYGIGAGPDGTENLGCCTQMVVFERADDAEPFTSAREDPVGIHNYELLKHFEYPVFKDVRTTEEKILHEIQFQLPHLVSSSDFYNYEDCECEIPLSLLNSYVAHLCSSEEELRIILESNGVKTRLKNDTWYIVYSESDLNSSKSSSENEDWLNEDILDDKDIDVAEIEDWDKNEEKYQDEMNYHSYRQGDSTETFLAVNKVKTDSSLEKAKTTSVPHTGGQLIQHLSCPKVSPLQFQQGECKRRIPWKSKIPQKMPVVSKDQCRSEERVISQYKRPVLSKACKRPNKISKSCSLDSCLENINCMPFEFESETDSESYYLNLMSVDSVPFRRVSSLSSNKTKRVSEGSGCSLLSSSLDRAADSGYPISFSSPETDLTPEQVDDLFTENEIMSRSTSASSDVEMVDAVNRIPHDLFADVAVVENGDLANNNRDGEGNNVEGLIGQRLVNAVAGERDPNDNMMFFPEIEDFPNWLLNLVELAQRPVFIPVDDLLE